MRTKIRQERMTPKTFLCAADKLHHWTYVEKSPYVSLLSLNITSEEKFAELTSQLTSDDFLYKGCHHGNMFTLKAQEHQIMFLILMAVISNEEMPNVND